ncbi:MAG: LuxR C-terminal-related transcriptional regulator [Prevotellaceae bacterium]|jgi:DNA-binding NarL/FixJ family response regulator|nr:LuxR C-terminal-related transcriptional regulator [Prevotellaceae bacterium]
MYKTIAIIEKSNIIKEGLTYLLKAHNICAQIAKLDSIDDWFFVFKEEKPDMIIINPDRLKDTDLDRIRQKIGISDKVPIIGLLYQYFDREIYNMFSSTIYVTDTEDVILGTLRNKQKKEQEVTTGEKLTDREKSVLKLLLKGLSNKEVADKLVISPHTVITHRKNIVEKTGIRSLSGLAIYAILNNITNMDEISTIEN